MKLLLPLIALVIANPLEITSQLPAHNQRSEYVSLPEGRWSVETYTNNDSADLTCTYWHLNQKLLTQEHTNHCYAEFNINFPIYMWVVVQNNENHYITYHLKTRKN